jgi:hypothetical protein
MWYLTRMNLGLGNNIEDPANAGVGSAMTNEVVAFTFPLRLSVCQQLNNNLSAADLNADPVAATLAINAWGKLAPPAAGQQWSSVVNLDQNAGTAAANAGAATFLPVINGSPRQNFCVSSTDVSSTDNRFVYGQTVFIQ